MIRLRFVSYKEIKENTDIARIIANRHTDTSNIIGDPENKMTNVSTVPIIIANNHTTISKVIGGLESKETNISMKKYFENLAEIIDSDWLILKPIKI